MSRSFLHVIAVVCGAAILLSGGAHVAASEEAKADTATATPLSASEMREITLESYLEEVLGANLSYAAQRYNVDIAEAEAAAARLWPNPTLALSAGRDLTFHGKKAVDGSGQLVSQTLPEARSISLSQPFDISGKRHWRIRTADQTYKAVAADLNSFLINLQLDAAAAFAEALAARATLEQQRKAAEYMSELASVQHVRLKTGDISEADYLQSRIEALLLQNDLKAAQADATAAQYAMCTFLGRDSGLITLIPIGALQAPTHDYQLDQLVAQALDARADLVALRHMRDAAQYAVRLSKAERFGDIELSAIYTHNPASSNIIAGSPRYNELGVGLSTPLPLWNRNHYEIRKAQALFNQSRRQLEAAELQTEVEIRAVLTHYRAALERVRQFQDELLNSAETVLVTRRKSYEYGEISLLELLEAQRTANDIRKNYHNAIADAVKVHIEIQRAAALTENPIFNTNQ